jgi:RNase H-like domain found in reverse transcriptase
MCEKPVLCQSNFTKSFHLHTDASAYGMGAILSQEGDSTHTNAPSTSRKPELHPVAYYSATFTETDCNYNIYN